MANLQDVQNAAESDVWAAWVLADMLFAESPALGVEAARFLLQLSLNGSPETSQDGIRARSNLLAKIGAQLADPAFLAAWIGPPCEGTYRYDPVKRFVRCDVCGDVNYRTENDDTTCQRTVRAKGPVSR